MFRWLVVSALVVFLCESCKPPASKDKYQVGSPNAGTDLLALELKCPVPCKNGGFCKADTATCSCPDKWTGSACETPVDGPAPGPGPGPAPTPSPRPTPAPGPGVTTPSPYSSAPAPRTSGSRDCKVRPYYSQGHVATHGHRTVDGVRTYTATYKCSEGRLRGTSSISCVPGNGWTRTRFDCAGTVMQSRAIQSCGGLSPAVGPFSDPEPADQQLCVNGRPGPPTRCITGSAQTKLLPVSIPEVLNRHNCWRANVNPPAVERLKRLKWDEELAVLAERWAASCPTWHDPDDDRRLPQRSSKGVSWNWVGQNICWSTEKQPWSECIDGLGMEVLNFRHGTGSVGDHATGHYTQMVSDRSTHVGCGWAYCPSRPNGFSYVQVCNYGPGGNHNGGEKTPYQKADFDYGK